MNWSFLTAAAALVLQPAPASERPNDPPADVMSLTIDEAVEIALDRNFRVQRSVRSAEIAELQVDSTRAGLRPRFDSRIRAGQTQNYSEFTGSAFRFSDLNPDFSTSLDAVASMPLDLWGVTARRVKQAEYSRDAVNLGLEQTALDVAIEIRGLYLRALQSRARLAARQDTSRELEALIARSARDQPSIVRFLELERDLARQQVESGETEFELALAQLSQAMRLPPSATLALESGLPRPLPLVGEDRLFTIASQSRTDLRQAEINLDQARLRREQAKDSRRPTLGVDAFANLGATGRSPLFGDRDSGRSLGVGLAARLDIPLLQYDGHVLRNARRVADIQAEQALADHAEALERARNDIDRILISLNRLAGRLASLPDIAGAEASLREAEEVLLSAAPAEASGMTAQVSNARAALQQARLARGDTLAEYDLAVVQLSRAIGIDLFE